MTKILTNLVARRRANDQKENPVDTIIKKSIKRKDSLGDTQLGGKLARNGNLAIPDNYNGPRITSPITMESFIDMVNHFKEGGQLHYRYVYRITMETTKVLQREPSVKDVLIPKLGRLTIVGDIHGQLSDL